MTKMDAMPCYFAAEMIGHWPFNWHAWNGEKLPPFGAMGKRTVEISICARLTVLETEVWGENSGQGKVGHGSLGVRVCRGRLLFTLFLMLHSTPQMSFCSCSDTPRLTLSANLPFRIPLGFLLPPEVIETAEVAKESFSKIEKYGVS